MKYLQFTQYVYLLVGLFFIYHGFSERSQGNDPWISFGIAAVSIFMFFFRRHYAKKFEQRNRNDQE